METCAHPSYPYFWSVRMPGCLGEHCVLESAALRRRYFKEIAALSHNGGRYFCARQFLGKRGKATAPECATMNKCTGRFPTAVFKTVPPHPTYLWIGWADNKTLNHPVGLKRPFNFKNNGKGANEICHKICGARSKVETNLTWS